MAKPTGVVASHYVTIHADVAVGETCTHTQLLNGIWPILCNFVAITHLTNAEKVAHVAPLLCIGQLRTIPKSPVVTLDTLMSQVEGTISKGGEKDLCPGGEKNCPRWMRTRKAFKFDMAATPASAR